jgi:hypothetical protein
MNTANYILKKYNIKTDVIEIPNAGRDELAQLLPELDFKIGVEVGVAAGEYSLALMQANPQMTLYGVDPYTPYRGYKDYVRLGTYTSLKEQAHKLLDGFPNYHFIEEFSTEAVLDFEDNSLDFVYLDGNHSYPYIDDDIAAWYPKIRKGGVLAGHDYARIKGKGNEDSTNWAVIPALHKYAQEHDLQIYVWGLEAKIDGLKRDVSRSWMLLK